MICAVIYGIKYGGDSMDVQGQQKKTIAKLEHTSGRVPNMHVEKGVIPPTNQWFSGVVFGDNRQPAYAYPLSFQVKNAGVTISYPTPTAVADTVYANHTDAIAVDMGAPNAKLAGYDDLTMTLNYYDAQNKLVAQSTAAHGSPYFFITLKKDQNISITSKGGVVAKAGDTYKITEGSRVYGVGANATIQNKTSLTINAKAGDTVTIFAAPNTASYTKIAQYARHRVTGGSVSYDTQDQSLYTKYKLKTDDGGDTLFAHHTAMDMNSESIAAPYTSLYGPLQVSAGTSWQASQKLPAMNDQLSIDKLSNDQKQELMQLVRQDTGSLNLEKKDTYFGGKELYRTAQLLSLAKQLGMNSEATAVQDKLRDRLDDWLTLTSDKTKTSLRFYYDDQIHGLVGLEPSFGSDEFNDHHFHYGYFLYASAILGRYDAQFIEKNKDALSLIISDIASTKQTDVFPKNRVFDQYLGHSWASGYGDFFDGNNQESSSEATNAWFGMYMLSQQMGDAKQQDFAQALYTREQATASQYWLSNSVQQNFPGYAHVFASLRWGGKIDAATFFSPRPQAKVGIQLIPMSMAQQNLNSKNVKATLQEVAPETQDYQGQFGDYLAMYLAITDKNAAINIAKNLPVTAIDDGNSRSYMMAWIYTQ